MNISQDSLRELRNATGFVDSVALEEEIRTMPSLLPRNATKIDEIDVEMFLVPFIASCGTAMKHNSPAAAKSVAADARRLQASSTDCEMKYLAGLVAEAFS